MGEMLVACEYCDRELSTSQMTRHEAVCIHNPDVEASVRECIAYAALGPFMPSKAEYDNARTLFDNVPTARTLFAALETNWRGVAHWAGYRPQSERLEYTLEALRDISNELHNGIIGPSASEWDTQRPVAALSSQRMMERLGKWAEVLTAAGLVSGSRSYYMAHTRRRQIDASGDVDNYIADARRKARNVNAEYPLLPGRWRVKQYALWPAGQRVTSLVYELR